MVRSGFPDGWWVRPGPRAGVTVIHGWESRLGVVVAAALAWLLVPLLVTVYGGWGALLALLMCLVIGLGLGYRLVIAPEGIVYQRTWYGLCVRRKRLSLQTPVVTWSTFELPEGDAVILKSKPPVTLSARVEDVAELENAVQEAILRAGREQPYGEAGGAKPSR